MSTPAKSLLTHLLSACQVWGAGRMALGLRLEVEAVRE